MAAAAAPIVGLLFKRSAINSGVSADKSNPRVLGKVGGLGDKYEGEELVDVGKFECLVDFLVL